MAVATRWPLVGRRGDLDMFKSAFTDPGCEGFCVYGPSGVGKTRLGDECLDVAKSAGRRVLRATADRSTETIPFGAVAHFMPARALGGLGGELFDPAIFAKQFDTARRALAPTADESGIPVVLLDDAHLLDAASLTLVDRLLGQRLMFGIVTVVAGAPVPETVTRWWRDERAVRIDLTELDEVDVDTLLHIALEGPLDADASSHLWQASRGNVLALRELVLGARAQDVLVCRDGVWLLEGELRTPQRLRELIEARIARLDAPAQDVVERLALCQPLGLGELEDSAGLTTLEHLERDGLIVVRNDERRESVRLAHPLHGDVIRSRMSALRRRSILLAEAGRVEGHAAKRREDPVRISTWRLEATGRADPALLVLAACLARYDHKFRRAADLARAALGAERSAAAGLVLGEALYNLGSFEEAERALAAATESADDDEHIVRIATVRRRNLFRGCRREAEAVAVGQEAMSRVTSPVARDELRAGEAEVLAISGRPLDALDLLDNVDTATPRVRVLAAMPRAVALATIGRTNEAIAVSEQAYLDHLALGDELGIATPGTHRVNLLFAMVQAGRLDDADERGSEWFDLAARARAPLGVIWIGVHLARCAINRGRPMTALERSERVCAAIDASGFEGLRPAALAVQAIAHGILGDAAASAELADRVEASTLGFGFIAPELPLARAWALIAAGALAAARDLLVTAADDAERLGHLPSAAWLFHDAARIDASGPAAPRLEALASRCDSALVAARSAHATALFAEDEERLVEAADRFEVLGARLLAAEAIAAAADISRRRREQRRAAALDIRSDALAATCEGSITPALTRSAGVVPLTDREREIAMLAASGHSSRSIAGQLFVSVRTIDNHLGRIYAKLGVSSRAALATALERKGSNG
jgi:DNA-binding CsgD family transcriptional regulator